MKHWLIILVSSVIVIAAGVIGFAAFRSIMKGGASGNGSVVRTLEGEKISGQKSIYMHFTKDDYQRALDGDKVIFLDFSANWCPLCRAEASEIKAGFNALQNDRVIGFRVNYNDSETDADEKALAEQFKITYQHTKVILVDGKEVFRTGDTWTKEDFDSIVNPILAQ